MKLLTLNFTTCPVKACKSSGAAFPLQIRDAELEVTELDFQPLFLRNMMPRIEWPAMAQTAAMVGMTLPECFRKELTVTAAAAAAAAAEEEKMDVVVEGEGQRKEGETTTTIISGGGTAATRAEPDVETTSGGKVEEEHETEVDEDSLKKLHRIILETEIMDGKLVCANCAMEYPIREGIANFLLPPHMV